MSDLLRLGDDVSYTKCWETVWGYINYIGINEKSILYQSVAKLKEAAEESDKLKK